MPDPTGAFLGIFLNVDVVRRPPPELPPLDGRDEVEYVHQIDGSTDAVDEVTTKLDRATFDHAPKYDVVHGST